MNRIAFLLIIAVSVISTGCQNRFSSYVGNWATDDNVCAFKLEPLIKGYGKATFRYQSDETIGEWHKNYGGDGCEVLLKSGGHFTMLLGSDGILDCRSRRSSGAHRMRRVASF